MNRGSARFRAILELRFCDMDNRWTWVGVFVGIFVVVGLAACTGEGESPRGEERTEESEAELALRMSRLQRWTHKTALAAQAESPELAEFYLHEMEETINGIRSEVPVYEGHEIKALTTEMLGPQVEALDQAVEGREWSTVEARLRDLETACNQCHGATEHGFVRIDLEDIRNPYIQNFSSTSPADARE